MSDKRKADKAWKLTPSTPKSASNQKEDSMKTNINIQQVSEIKVSYHPKVETKNRYSVYSPDEAYKLLMKEAFNDDTLEYKEYFKLILLNKAKKVLGITTISEGGMDGTVVDVRLILQVALLTHSRYIIIAHNHPASLLQPSKHDDDITRKIEKAAQLMDITLSDHLIVTRENYYSYANEGKL